MALQHNEKYSPLGLAVALDELAVWIQSTHADWSPQRIAQEMREEVDRIEDEMLRGEFK